MGCSNSKIKDRERRKSKSNKMFKKSIKDMKADYEQLEILSNTGRLKRIKVHHNPTKQIRLCKQIFKENIVGQNQENSNTDELFEHLCEIDDHINIPKIFEYFEDDISYYIIVEFAEGKELLNVIENVEYFTEKQVAIIMEQLFSCLNYLHLKNIVHGNIMPENIILDSEKIGDYYIKLVDFEKASIIRSDEKLDNKKQKENFEDIKYGQCYFLSPNRLSGKSEYKDDMWACGVIMYILLCGYPPFISDQLSNLLEKIKKGKIDYQEKDWTLISKDARNLVEKCLTVNPKKRISSSEAMNDPWIVKHIKSRNEEIERKLTNSKLEINTKIRRFSHSHSLERAVMAFIVRHTSTNKQANQLRDIFKLMDTNREGRLTYDELLNGYKKFFKNSTLSQEEYMDICKSFDRDGSEYVEFEEFLTAFLKSELILTERNLKYAFDYFDNDKSGYLSSEEIKKILNFNNNSLINAEDLNIDEMIKSFDKNSDGQVSFDEFLTLMKKVISK